MTNQLLEEMSPGVGHNRGPSLAEEIAEILEPFRGRQEEILAVAASAKIESEIEAQKITDLVQICRSFEHQVDAERTKLKQPYLDACRQIDRAFNGFTGPVSVARYGEDGKGGLLKLLDRYKKQKDAEAKAAGATAEPIRSDLGTVGTLRTIEFKVLDLGQVIDWLMRNPDLAGQLETAVRHLVYKYLRGLGVVAVENGAGRIPGTDVQVVHRAAVR